MLVLKTNRWLTAEVVNENIAAAAYAWLMSTDEEKDPPVPADVEGKIPKKVHDAPDAEVRGAPTDKPDHN